MIICAVLPSAVLAQALPVKTYPLSLNEAVTLPKNQNKWVQIARTEAKASQSDLKDAYSAARPLANASSSYQRFSASPYIPMV